MVDDGKSGFARCPRVPDAAHRGNAAPQVRLRAARLTEPAPSRSRAGNRPIISLVDASTCSPMFDCVDDAPARSGDRHRDRSEVPARPRDRPRIALRAGVVMPRTDALDRDRSASIGSRRICAQRARVRHRRTGEHDAADRLQNAGSDSRYRAGRKHPLRNCRARLPLLPRHQSPESELISCAASIYSFPAPCCSRSPPARTQVRCGQGSALRVSVNSCAVGPTSRRASMLRGAARGGARSSAARARSLSVIRPLVVPNFRADQARDRGPPKSFARSSPFSRFKLLASCDHW